MRTIEFRQYLRTPSYLAFFFFNLWVVPRDKFTAAITSFYFVSYGSLKFSVEVIGNCSKDYMLQLSCNRWRSWRCGRRTKVGYDKNMIYSVEIKSAVTKICSLVNINHRTRVIADCGLETISLGSRCEEERRGEIERIPVGRVEWKGKDRHFESENLETDKKSIWEVRWTVPYQPPLPLDQAAVAWRCKSLVENASKLC